jgi:hypothetical protein
VFDIKDRAMNNAQNCDSYINIASSQTYSSHYIVGLLTETFPVRYEYYPACVLNKRTMDKVQNCDCCTKFVVADKALARNAVDCTARHI